MDFGEPSPDIIAKLYNEIKEKKILELDWKSQGKKNRSKKKNLKFGVFFVIGPQSYNKFNVNS